MKTTPRPSEPLDRLLSWARRPPAPPPDERPPCGFSTRVLAACARKAPPPLWWEYLALRGALAGGTVAAACWLLQPQAPSVNEEAALAASILQTALHE